MRLVAPMILYTMDAPTTTTLYSKATNEFFEINPDQSSKNPDYYEKLQLSKT